MADDETRWREVNGELMAALTASLFITVVATVIELVAHPSLGQTAPLVQLNSLPLNLWYSAETHCHHCCCSQCVVISITVVVTTTIAIMVAVVIIVLLIYI